jgi:hypothetical protein
MMNPLIYTQEDLAAAFAIAEPRAMVKALRNLINTHQFPRPLPGMQCRWPKAAVDEWLIAHGALPCPKPSLGDFVTNDNTVTMEPSSITKLLERAYAPS